MKRFFMEQHYPIRVLRGDTLLGTLEIDDADQPWLLCSFTPAPAFDEVRALFEEDNRTIAPSPAFDRIQALGLRLVAVNGESDMFILHIDGERASFRYADFSPYLGIDRYGWKIREDLLPGPSQGRLPGSRDRWFVNVRSDTACLVYETRERRGKHRVGMVAVYEQKTAPRLIINPHRFQCAASDDTVKWEDAFAGRILLRITALAYEQLVFALVDLQHFRFSWLDGIDVAAQEVWDMGAYFQVVEERQQGGYDYLQRLPFDALPWFNLARIEEFVDLCRPK